MSVSNRHRKNELNEAVVNSRPQEHSGPLAKAIAAILLCSTAPAIVSAAGFEDARTFTIRSQPLTSALMEFAEQSNIQVITSADELKQFETSGVQGNVTIEEALRRLLEGTGLSYRKVGEGTVTIAPATRARSKPQAMQSVSYEKPEVQTRVARSPNGTSTASATDDRKQDDAVEKEDKRQLQEIVVTGSSIRGMRNEALPITVITSEQIRETGLATLPDVLHSLPQNFRGFPTPSGSVHADLRGIGSKYTLVLLNGRRLGSSFEDSGPDLALIPLETIERIEVLTDGASATYGADAIGGVINIITRKDYVGAETSGRFGASSGSYQTRRLTQLLGTGWGSGNMLVNYTFNDQTMLRSDERGFLESSSISLVHPYETQAAFITVRQSIADAELSVDGTYSARDSTAQYTYGTYDNEDENRGISLKARIPFREWGLDVSAGLNRAESYYSFDAFESTASGDTRFSAFNLSGPLVRLPGGVAHLATGLEFQQQEQRVDQQSVQLYSERRETSSMYGEVMIPLVGAGNAMPGLKRLEVTAAGRFDDYSSFGDVFKPKFSLLWSPIDNLNARATWGESFKVPTLQELFYVRRESLMILSQSDPLSASGQTLAVQRSGYSEDLRPERGTSWSVGLDFKPESVPGARVSLTYSDLDFRDKIEYPNVTFESADAYKGLLVRRPLVSDAAENSTFNQAIQELVARATTVYYIGVPADTFDIQDVGAIVDNRTRNLSKRRVRVIDAVVGYEWESLNSTLTTELSLTHLLDQWQQYTPALPRVEVMNQVEAPPRLRARAKIAWRKSSWSANLFVNYTGGYDDVRTIAEGPIDAWLTLDLNARYDVGSQAPSFLEGTSVALTITNLLHEMPPYVVQTSPSIAAYDTRNADALGRVVALEITKRWGGR